MRGMRSETAHAHYIGLMHLFAASPLLWAKDYVGRLKPEQITILENVFGDETPTASDVLEQGMVVNAAFQEDRQWDNECECDECDECDNA